MASSAVVVVDKAARVGIDPKLLWTVGKIAVGTVALVGVGSYGVRLFRKRRKHKLQEAQKRAVAQVVNSYTAARSERNVQGMMQHLSDDCRMTSYSVTLINNDDGKDVEQTQTTRTVTGYTNLHESCKDEVSQRGRLILVDVADPVLTTENSFLVTATFNDAKKPNISTHFPAKFWLKFPAPKRTVPASAPVIPRTPTSASAFSNNNDPESPQPIIYAYEIWFPPNYKGGDK